MTTYRTGLLATPSGDMHRTYVTVGLWRFGGETDSRPPITPLYLTESGRHIENMVAPEFGLDKDYLTERRSGFVNAIEVVPVQPINRTEIAAGDIIVRFRERAARAFLVTEVGQVVGANMELWGHTVAYGMYDGSDGPIEMTPVPALPSDRHFEFTVEPALARRYFTVEETDKVARLIPFDRTPTPLSDDEAEIARLRAERDGARQAETETRRRHAADIAMIGEVLIEEAESRNWCSEYDEVIARLNEHLSVPLPVRSRSLQCSVSAQWSGTLTLCDSGISVGVDVTATASGSIYWDSVDSDADPEDLVANAGLSEFSWDSVDISSDDADIEVYSQREFLEYVTDNFDDAEIEVTYVEWR